MKFLLILTFINSAGFADASRHEYPNQFQCNEAGFAQTSFWLSHVPGIDRVTWECVEKRYGK